MESIQLVMNLICYVVVKGFGTVHGREFLFFWVTTLHVIMLVTREASYKMSQYHMQ